MGQLDPLVVVRNRQPVPRPYLVVAVIGAAFETAFGRDGLGALPWIEGNLVVCPGAMVSKSRASQSVAARVSDGGATVYP